MVDTSQKYKYGVYLTSEGLLVHLQQGSKLRYALVRGDKCLDRTINAAYDLQDTEGPYVVITFSDCNTADELLKDCEYIGEF